MHLHELENDEFLRTEERMMSAGKRRSEITDGL